MKDDSRAKELQRLIKGGGGIKKSRHEVPLDSIAERQCFASITGCHTEPVMDPVDIFEE